VTTANLFFLGLSSQISYDGIAVRKGDLHQIISAFLLVFLLGLTVSDFAKPWQGDRRNRKKAQK
jgi:hypothetical protein